MSELNYAEWFNGKHRAIAWCPDCCTHGTPFMDRNDRVCGNCNGTNLEYLISETALKDARAKALDEVLEKAKAWLKREEPNEIGNEMIPAYQLIEELERIINELKGKP